MVGAVADGGLAGLKPSCGHASRAAQVNALARPEWRAIHCRIVAPQVVAIGKFLLLDAGHVGRAASSPSASKSSPLSSADRTSPPPRTHMTPMMFLMCR